MRMRRMKTKMEKLKMKMKMKKRMVKMINIGKMKTTMTYSNAVEYKK